MLEYTYKNLEHHVSVFRYNRTYHLEYYGNLICVGRTEYEVLRYFEKKYHVEIMEG